MPLAKRCDNCERPIQGKNGLWCPIKKAFRVPGSRCAEHYPASLKDAGK